MSHANLSTVTADDLAVMARDFQNDWANNLGGTDKLMTPDRRAPKLAFKDVRYTTATILPAAEMLLRVVECSQHKRPVVVDTDAALIAIDNLQRFIGDFVERQPESYNARD